MTTSPSFATVDSTPAAIAIAASRTAAPSMPAAPIPASSAGASASAIARNSESTAARPFGSPDDAIDSENTVWPVRES